MHNLLRYYFNKITQKLSFMVIYVQMYKMIINLQENSFFT